MRNFNTKGLSRKALDQVYEITLTQKLCLEAKLERLTKELSVGACAIEDNIVTPDETRKGLMNLIAYSVAKIDLSQELDTDLKSLDLINWHSRKIKEYELNRMKMNNKK